MPKSPNPVRNTIKKMVRKKATKPMTKFFIKSNRNGRAVARVKGGPTIKGA